MPYIQYEIALQYGYDPHPFHQNIQELKEGIKVCPTNYFDPAKVKKESYIKHWAVGGWVSDNFINTQKRNFIQKILIHLLRPILRKFNIEIASIQ